MTPKSTTKIYPGLLCNSIEFFILGNETKVISNGSVKSFIELPFATIELLKETINNDELIQTKLIEMHPNSEMKRIEQFARCRFGGLDFEGDIKNGILQDGEYWPCPSHGNCQAEGILCKLPIYNGKRLTNQDVSLVRLTSTTKTNEVIADEMNVPLGTFHKLKKNLYKKLGVQTKQEIASIGFLLNLIQF